MEWRFKILTRNDTLQNASHLEFFHNEALDSAVDALVREDIQNRLDARAPNEPFVEVKYKLCGPKASVAVAAWFKQLQPHLASQQVRQELGYQPSVERPINWLVIEDFRTTGLQGDPTVYQDPENLNGGRNDFFWFVRNVGRSGKKAGDRGRWGLGKVVYPAASKIRSFFAYTVRKNDLRQLLIGRSVLAVHHRNGMQHDSEGYFGRFDDPDHEYFATPEDSEQELQRFKDDFQITRQNNQPGLSLVIPWRDDDITFATLLASMVEHWFWAILDGQLQVTIAEDGGNSLTLTADSIESVANAHLRPNTIEGQQTLRKLRFGRTSLAMDIKSNDFFNLLPYRSGSAPKWDSAENLFDSDDAVGNAKNAFHAGRIVGFDVPVRVRRSDGTLNDMASFSVYLQKTDQQHPPIEVFLREGLCISGQKYLREAGLLAIVRVEEDSLGTMLGDAENPAHTKWERSGKHFKNKYEYGPSILTYVQRSALHLCSLLSRRQEGLDPDLLQNLFFIADEGAQTALQPRRTGGGNRNPLPVITPRQVYVECNKIAGGFRVHPNPRATQIPAFIQIRAAYEVIRGNPFRLHHEADFNFANPVNIQVHFTGLVVSKAEATRLVFEVKDKNFELTAVGFDTHRDLIVDVKPLHALAPSSEVESEMEESKEEDEV